MKKSIILGKNIALSNFKDLAFPYKLTFILTYRCNGKCRTCKIWKRKIKKEMSLKEIERFFKKSNKFSWIDISGGEIFLRKDLIEIIKIILKNCKNLYLLHFPTNGLMPDLIAKKVKEIKNLKPNKLIITVSLDGPPKLHDNIRGIKGSWEKSLQTFIQLKKIRGVETYFGMTLSSYNFNKIEETYSEIKKRIKDISYKDFHINIAQSSKHYYGVKLKESSKEIIKDIHKFIKLKGISFNPVQLLEHKYLTLTDDFLINKKIPLKCKALCSSCFIDPHGEVYPCNIHNKKLGNLKDFDYDIKKIWDLPETKKIRKEIIGGECPQCWTACEAYQTIFGNLLNKKILMK